MENLSFEEIEKKAIKESKMLAETIANLINTFFIRQKLIIDYYVLEFGGSRESVGEDIIGMLTQVDRIFEETLTNILGFKEVFNDNRHKRVI